MESRKQVSFMGHSIPKWISCSDWWIPSRKTKNIGIEHQCVLCGRPYLWEQMWKVKSPQPASVHGIVHGTLGYRNASRYWDQKQLRECHIQMHCVWCDESTIEALLVEIITFDESWLHVCTLETDMYSMIQKHKHPSNKEVQNSEFCSELWSQSSGMPEMCVAGTLLTGETVSTVCFYTTLNRLRVDLDPFRTIRIVGQHLWF